MKNLKKKILANDEPSPIRTESLNYQNFENEEKVGTNFTSSLILDFGSPIEKRLERKPKKRLSLRMKKDFERMEYELVSEDKPGSVAVSPLLEKKLLIFYFIFSMVFFIYFFFGLGAFALAFRK